ncbi:adenylyltransferase/cytidyltransferase family protein [candidate division KSB3 bacterium]|uniref:Adenylyltransferase/cytidyltransferase family protein n=1 Tax=candidate division KSB3 bacterium TaxID=2044937 RepID=A0A9D5K1C8_9BACT|nr:adenylyltransferase/cytidyltransferase family protein [candidate division KSB3 bacterium]MBD3327656.1 adenylyltransferase/cytidyltransferase family protein [candidate division KSB3 bacterium]
MTPIDLKFSVPNPSQIQTLCGFLGSFDPLHRGHEWIVEHLLQQFDAVLLLIPARHFEKTVQFPRNATFRQRIEMLASLRSRHGTRIAAGLAHEVLFIRLAEDLRSYFPHADIFFGMGNETFERFLDSPRYYVRSGIPWTAAEQAKLDHLRDRIVVFGRSEQADSFVTVPAHLRGISSTLVRETVMALRSIQAPGSLWQQRLSSMISPAVLELILQQGVYAV